MYDLLWWLTEIIHHKKLPVSFNDYFYLDYGTDITKVFAFTQSLMTMKKYVDSMSANGGGDAPECLATGLYDALHLDYRQHATKVCVLITDAPPHGLEGMGNDGFPDGDPGLCSNVFHILSQHCLEYLIQFIKFLNITL
jgi:hypothetical protein